MATPFVYHYGEAVWRSMDDVFRPLAEAQIEDDIANNASTPMLDFDVELLPGSMDGMLQMVSLGDPVATFDGSVAFRLEGTPSLVIKYQSNCGRIRKVHPSLREFWILKHLEQLGISPAARFVSPPAKLEFPITPKTGFPILFRKRVKCVADSRSTVRYIVMDSVGESMHSVMTRNRGGGAFVPLKLAVRMLHDLVKVLKVMHSHGIVHGDIRPSSVVYIRPSEIGLIDFAGAFFAEGRKGKPERVAGSSTPRNLDGGGRCMGSVYILEGARWSYRDDLFAAVLTAAILMNGMRYWDYCQSLERDYVAMRAFKHDSFLFQDPSGPDVIRRLPVSSELQIDIIQRLNQVLQIVRSQDMIDEFPAYDAVSAQLRGIISALP